MGQILERVVYQKATGSLKGNMSWSLSKWGGCVDTPSGQAPQAVPSEGVMPGDLLMSCEELGSGHSLSCLLYTGPLCSVCVNRFGCRPVMLVGGLFASLGMVAASFCQSIIQIYLTTGVITGE